MKPMLAALALGLAACSPPAAPEAEPAAATTAPAQPAAAGSVSAVLTGGAAPLDATMPASECMIVNEGANGVVRAADGTFELNWANGAFRVIWNSDQGLYNGGVTGEVSGQAVSFTGTNGAMSVTGTATCG